MGEITKHVDDSLYFIRHAYRELPSGKVHGNEDLDSSLTSTNNYSLLKGRCHTANEANSYRKEIEKELFKYNRKGLVRTIEIVIQCPDDCIEKKAFFETAYNYVCNQYLPMGERCVVTAMVHGDEHKYLKDIHGNFMLDENGNKIDISKDHLHIIAVPAVPDKKHSDFDFKLCAHDLTSKSRFKAFHPGLQKACDDAGIQATVVKKKSGDGKTIGLSVKQLKEITNKTGIVLDRSLTIDQLAEILKVNRDIKIHDHNLRQQLQEKEEKIEVLSSTVANQERTISDLESKISFKDSLVEKLQGILHQKEAEISNSHSSDLQFQKDNLYLQEQLAKANQRNEELTAQMKEIQEELELSRQKEKELEVASKKSTQEQTWGTSNSWGSSNSWGNTNSWGDTSKTYSEDKTW